MIQKDQYNTVHSTQRYKTASGQGWTESTISLSTVQANQSINEIDVSRTTETRNKFSKRHQIFVGHVTLSP